VSETLWVVGDVQGFLSPLRRVLRSANILSADDAWSAGNATLAVLGDLVDRGPDGVGVIDLLMRLQVQAASHGGRVQALIGNHDILLLAARGFGEPFMANWLLSGGMPHDLEALTDAQAAWLRALPAVVVERDAVLLHADAMFYLDYGSSPAEVNAAFRDILDSEDPVAHQRLLDQFGEHRAFQDPDGEVNLGTYLHTFGAARLIHGHTPIPRMLQVPPETVTEAHVYRDGRCANVDPGIYLGGPGFVYQALP
jgi:hypothetical protein